MYVLSLAVALSTMQMTVQFSSVPTPQSLGRTPGDQGPPTTRLLTSTSQKDLQLDVYLEYSHAVKALYIYEHPYLLRDSNPDLRHSSQRR
ncbi:hypothetical protein TNCV_2885181 [Trichonephila clavipes]|nr:hypothetical protein TNCV_2885181 [Trichonephila clavipes]